MAGLNDMQDIACRHVDGPLLILAGAGSGKTRVLTHRVARLISEEGVRPYNILAITFTNKAAREMRERVNDIVGYGAEQVWVSTFHSMCVRILRRYADRIGYTNEFAIYDTDDEKRVIKDIMKQFQIDPKRYPEKMFMAKISDAKEKYLSPDEFESEHATEFVMRKVADVYREYQSRLKRYNAMDFDDLIFKTIELFEHNPDVLFNYQERFKYIMVDEYQDTNHTQFLLVKLLAAKYKNLCVVGDDDQSIYKFRGANITNILNFENEYPDAKVVKLEQNYRSVGNILNAANAVIKHNEGRKDKALWTDKPEGDKLEFDVAENEYEEAEKVAYQIHRLYSSGVDYKDIAILYRTNAQSRIMGEKLVMANIPHKVYGGQNFYDRKEIRDILSYMKAVNNPDDDIAVKRIINVPRRGIGDTTVEKASAWAAEHECSLMEALRQAKEIDSLKRVAAKIGTFVELMDGFHELMLEKEPLESIFDRIMEDTGYEEELIAEHTEEAMGRLENLDDLRNKVIQFSEEHEGKDDAGSLSAFLEEVALVADIDSMSEDESTVKLMTLHSAKGLEFPYVFIIGMEERIFPSGIAIDSDDPDNLEEERRLCYVGITRAMKKLYLSAAKCRMMHGSHSYNEVSRFIREIPPILFEHSESVWRDARKTANPFKNSYSSFGGDGDFDHGYGGSGSYGGAGGYGSGRGGYSSDRGVGSNSYGGGNAGGYGSDRGGAGSSGYGKKYGSNNPYSAGKPSFGREFVVQSDTAIDYAEGDRVKSIKFGPGTVTSLVKGGKDYEVTVDFDRCGVRKMFASFAKLKKI